MKHSSSNTRHSEIPHAKYQIRIGDMDKASAAAQGFVEGKNCRNCLLHTKARNGGEECLVEVIRMQWPEPFEDSPYCLHPDIKKFVDMTHSVLARFDERKPGRGARAMADCNA